MLDPDLLKLKLTLNDKKNIPLITSRRQRSRLLPLGWVVGQTREPPCLLHMSEVSEDIPYCKWQTCYMPNELCLVVSIYFLTQISCSPSTRGGQYRSEKGRWQLERDVESYPVHTCLPGFRIVECFALKSSHGLLRCGKTQHFDHLGTFLMPLLLQVYRAIALLLNLTFKPSIELLCCLSFEAASRALIFLSER